MGKGDVAVSWKMRPVQLNQERVFPIAENVVVL